MTQAHPLPYANGVELLQDEIEGWVATRCRWLAVKTALKEHTELATRWLGVTGPEEDPSVGEPRRRLAALSPEEAEVRAAIDARIEATRAAGRDLGLVRVCRTLDLDAVDRAALLLAFAGTLGEEVVKVLEPISLYAYGDNPRIGQVARFCALGFAERVALHTRFGPESPLVREGLLNVNVELGEDESPSAWIGAELVLTRHGFTALTGLS